TTRIITQPYRRLPQPRQAPRAPQWTLRLPHPHPRQERWMPLQRRFLKVVKVDRQLGRHSSRKIELQIAARVAYTAVERLPKKRGNPIQGSQTIFAQGAKAAIVVQRTERQLAEPAIDLKEAARPRSGAKPRRRKSSSRGC